MRPDGSDSPQGDATRLSSTKLGARFSPEGTRLALLPHAAGTRPWITTPMAPSNWFSPRRTARNPVDLDGILPWAPGARTESEWPASNRREFKSLTWRRRSIVRQCHARESCSQLVWSPDGKRFVGTANGLGPYWNIGCLDLGLGEIRAVSETDRYNCTPDWTPDSQHVVYARGIIPEKGGRGGTVGGLG